VRRRRAPLWLRRLDRVAAELRTARFPTSADDGFQQMLELSASGRRMLREQVAAELPGTSASDVDETTHLVVSRMGRARAALTVRWMRERARYFRR